jgi:repressor of nif and glnA expression
MEATDEHISLTYQGIEVGEEGEILTEVINILEENGEEGVEKIFKSLKERGLKVGINRVRMILKSANGKELLEVRGNKGKRIYRLNPASQFHSSL